MSRNFKHGLLVICSIALIPNISSAFYAAHMGRWTCRDPIADRIGTSPLVDKGTFLPRDMAGYADGFNLYSYVSDSPLNFVDPSGEKSVNTGVEKCQGYQKGNPIWGHVPIHGFICIDGKGCGVFEQNNRGFGCSVFRDDDLTMYPKKNPADGDWYSHCVPITVDDQCYDPVKFANSIRQCIQRRKSAGKLGTGSYVVFFNDCNTFVEDCESNAQRESRQPNAPCHCQPQVAGYAR